ncbi:Na(+)-translocating NADH-quinone reductase subunit F [Lutimonas halocynthiae]|uniref:Na(+)-translocating NADH-quinone reductase subunit F n=1 Tax=Lutimonas halocynthiae TaxID=1446477 RepID=UPI0025B60606|nr:Na(+)-translocating NADH-quinone reductase subunit F [Lutimonas halocynthiae]MDN3641799.1 Na(+)-translocating NADH-quinone reductase subunit F [Lutimonas halocynthiae]
MQLPYRLEMALEKLYKAFYNDELDPENCCHCAVGNICDNVDAWKHLTDIHGSITLNYLGRLNQTMGKKINGYSPLELLSIEAVFLKACGYRLSSRNRLIKPAKIIDHEMMFKGLCAAIDYLCALDNVENVMELYKRFDLTAKRKGSVVV